MYAVHPICPHNYKPKIVGSAPTGGIPTSRHPHETPLRTNSPHQLKTENIFRKHFCSPSLSRLWLAKKNSTYPSFPPLSSQRTSVCLPNRIAGQRPRRKIVFIFPLESVEFVYCEA